MLAPDATEKECWEFIALRLLETRLRKVFGRKRYKRWERYPPLALLRERKRED